MLHFTQVVQLRYLQKAMLSDHILSTTTPCGFYVAFANKQTDAIKE